MKVEELGEISNIRGLSIAINYLRHRESDENGIAPNNLRRAVVGSAADKSTV